MLKYSIGYFRVPYSLLGISGYVGYFQVFRVDTIFLVAPKRRVYPKYQVIPDISGYPIPNDFQNWTRSGGGWYWKKVGYPFGPGDKGTNWRSSKEELISVLWGSDSCQCYLLVGRPPQSPQTAMAKIKLFAKGYLLLLLRRFFCQKLEKEHICFINNLKILQLHIYWENFVNICSLITLFSYSQLTVCISKMVDNRHVLKSR